MTNLERPSFVRDILEWQDHDIDNENEFIHGFTTRVTL